MTLANPGLTKAVALDPAGFPTATVVVVRKEGVSLVVTLPADALYVVVTP